MFSQKGITRLPSFNLHGEIKEGRLIELFLTYQKQQIDVHLTYPSRRHISSKVRSFIDFVINNLSDQDHHNSTL